MLAHRMISYAPRFACLAIAANMLAGCNRGGSPRLEGKWQGVRAEGVSGSASGAADQFAQGTDIEVKGSTITVETPKDKQSGHYRVVREDKTTVVIVTDKDGPSAPQGFVFTDNKTMKWIVRDGKSIVFQRQ